MLDQVQRSPAALGLEKTISSSFIVQENPLAEIVVAFKIKVEFLRKLELQEFGLRGFLKFKSPEVSRMIFEAAGPSTAFL